ncbi:hypothetical protein DFH09DRAFT_1108821 [Mycena vulgaris]|nr:hypothetical protein DFH09DRAFT_1108821 [Mycena vulgaris]
MPGISTARIARQEMDGKTLAYDHTHHSHDHIHTHPDRDDSETWDFDLGNELPDSDCDGLLPDQGPDLDEEIILAPEISDEKELDIFSTLLRDAQGAAQRAEQEREKSRKRPKSYFKNAPRTKRRHVQQAKDLEKKGFLNVFDYMAQIKAKKTEPSQSQKEQVSETMSISDSDSGPDSDSEVEPEVLTLDFNSLSDPVDENNTPDCMDPVNLAHVRLRGLLESVGHGNIPSDPTPESTSDMALNKLNYKDFPALRRAVASLTHKSKDKTIDVFFRARITLMVSTINLYLNSELSYTWGQALMLISKAQGHAPFDFGLGGGRALHRADFG